MQATFKSGPLITVFITGHNQTENEKQKAKWMANESKEKAGKWDDTKILHEKKSSIPEV